VTKNRLEKSFLISNFLRKADERLQKEFSKKASNQIKPKEKQD